MRGQRARTKKGPGRANRGDAATYYPPYASDVECVATNPTTITLGTPIPGPLPAEWTLSWVGTVFSAGGLLSWYNVCGIFQDANGVVTVALAGGDTLISADAPPPQAEITVVYRAAGESGQPTLSLYFDSGLEASISGPFAPFPANPGAVQIVQTSLVKLRIFSKATNPASDDLFWFNEPTAPLPAGLVAAYDLYAVPPVDRVSGQTLSGVSGNQIQIAGGRVWTDPNGDTPATTNFSPGTGGGGFTIQAQVFVSVGNVADFIVAKVIGKHSLTFGVSTAGVVQLVVDGVPSSTAKLSLGRGWCNLAVSVSPSSHTIFVNGVAMSTTPFPFGDFGATTTQIGGWSGAPGPTGDAFAVQSISFFSAPLDASAISSFLYTPPPSDPRCIGFFFALDGASLINMITGDAATSSAAGSYQRFQDAAAKYVFPALASSSSPVAVRPLERPAVDVAWSHAQRLVAGAGLAAGSREARLASGRLASGLRVGPSGDLVLLGQVLARETDGVVKFDVVTPRGLIEIERLAVAVGDPCMEWVTRFVLTAVTGFFSALTMVPGNTARMTEYATAFLRNRAAVQALRQWIGSQGGGDVDYQAYLRLGKTLYMTGSGALAIWNYFEGLNWYDRGLAVVSLGLTVTALFVPETPPTWVWIGRLAGQLTFTLVTLNQLLKQRPSSCPSAEFEPQLIARTALG